MHSLFNKFGVVSLIVLCSCSTSKLPFRMTMNVQERKDGKDLYYGNKQVVFKTIGMTDRMFFDIDGDRKDFKVKGLYYIDQKTNQKYTITFHMSETGFIFWVNSIDGNNCLTLSTDREWLKRK